MMRTRQTNRDFWKSEDIADLSHVQRLMFIGLWGMADREGMLLYKPRRISAEIFPYDAINKKDIEKWLDVMQGIGLIEFGHDGKNVITFIYIPNFNEYQHIHPNEARSKIKCHYITFNVIQCQPASASTSTSASTWDARTNSGELSDTKVTAPKTFSHGVEQLGNLLANHILNNDPGARIPTTEKQRAVWLDAIEKIHRIDGRSWIEIENVINWCQGDGFWKGNILSASKLRKQFPQLLVKMNSNGGRKMEGQALVDHNRRVLDKLNNELREQRGKV